MRITEVLSTRQSFSFEIFPPRGELSVEEASDIARALAHFEPDWVSVTFSAGGSGNSAGTIAVSRAVEQSCAAALAHFTCYGSSKADADAYVDELRAAGIDNVMALRGDPVPGKGVIDFAYARDLIAHIKERTPEMCVGAACYPEGHVECDDFELSMRHLHEKQEAGADFLVSQLFFDNELFYRFREACVRHRVKIPVVAGIMPFTSTSQIQRMAFTCGATIPARVIRRIAAAGDDPAAQIAAGVEYAVEQVVDLAANGVDGIHIYTMNKPSVGRAMYDALVSCGYLEGRC